MRHDEEYIHYRGIPSSKKREIKLVELDNKKSLVNELHTRLIDGLYAVVDVNFHHVFEIGNYEECFHHMVYHTCIPRYIQRNIIGEFEYGNCKLVLITKHLFPNIINILSNIDMSTLTKMLRPTNVYYDYVRSVVDDFDIWYDDFMKR